MVLPAGDSARAAQGTHHAWDCWMRKVSWPWATHAAHTHALLELSAAHPLRDLHVELRMLRQHDRPILSTWLLTSTTLTEVLAMATHIHTSWIAALGR